jgi:hypothetical protein
VTIGVRSILQSALLKKTYPTPFCERSETHYKILKFLDTSFDATIVIADHLKASPVTLKGLQYGRFTVGTMRDALGIIHLVTDVIPSIYFTLKIFFNLMRGLGSKEDVVLNPRKPTSQLAHYEIAQGTGEKLCCMGGIAMQLIQAGSSTFSFAVCRPLLFLKHEGFSLNTPLQSVADSYHGVMAIKHFSGLAKHAFELGYYSLAHQRALERGIDSKIVCQFYSKKVLELSVACIEKGLQFILSLAKLLVANLHPAFRIPFAFAIAGIGLYCTSLKTQ